MEHQQIRDLIHSYIDGELDAANARLIEDHLRTCAACRSLEANAGILRTTLTDSSPAYRAPARLRKNILAATRKEEKTQRTIFSPWLSFATAGAVCALLLLCLIALRTSRSSRNAIADQVIGNHVRSLMATHLVDVPSSDQHTVKPWFNGKIDFAPEVHDFAAEGFPLVGGRLDYLNGKTVAALVYRRDQHVINLLIAPVSGATDAPISALTRRGYHLLHWTRSGMEFWAVSDLNTEELRQFAEKTDSAATRK
jgi:anti-sigma factor RsiW